MEIWNLNICFSLNNIIFHIVFTHNTRNTSIVQVQTLYKRDPEESLVTFKSVSQIVFIASIFKEQFRTTVRL